MLSIDSTMKTLGVTLNVTVVCQYIGSLGKQQNLMYIAIRVLCYDGSLDHSHDKVSI